MIDTELRSDLAELGCVICGRPAQIHHIREHEGISQRAEDDDAFPLCDDHHNGGVVGMAIHADVEAWEAIHGSVWVHLRHCHEQIEERRKMRIGSRVQKTVVREHYGPRFYEERKERRRASRRKKKRKMS